jgi:hypothetical protein
MEMASAYFRFFKNKESWLKTKPTGGTGVDGEYIKVDLAEIASRLV